MKFDRASGILLHITSLPGGYGIGDIGPAAYQWIDFLAASACKYWQILPTGPTGYGDSPYQCFSAIAGNHYLISPALLIEEGLLKREALASQPEYEEDVVDFGLFIPWKLNLLTKSYLQFLKSGLLQKEYQEFIASEKEWLDNYALFMAIKDKHNLCSWTDWPEDLRDRNEKTIETFVDQHPREIEKHTYYQFIYFRQWKALNKHAETKNIKIIGDLPIYVAHDSVDVWVQPGLFSLFPDGKPEKMAGVPPDYFSPDGQLWGNPIYQWDVHQAQGYRWWIKRVSKILDMVDLVRLDHFRGFAAYWEIPAGSETAEIGDWKVGPGKGFFDSLQSHFGELPFIAEDLGEITPDVIKLRDHFSFAGMRIFQFAFDGKKDDPFLPHMYPEHSVAYAGTHDNEPILGWYADATDHERDLVDEYLKDIGTEMPWSMIQSLWQSRASLVLIQMQDVLSLSTESRMNFPSTPQGNWKWRMKLDALDHELQNKLLNLNIENNR